MSGRLVLAALLLPLLLVGACSRAPQAAPVPPPAFDISILREALDSNDLPVTSSEGTAQGSFGRLAQYQPLEVGGRPLHVYWFPSSSDASAAASAVSSGGRIGSTGVAPTKSEWNGEPNFFRRGSLVAVYVSESTSLTVDDTRVLRVLRKQMGPPLVTAEQAKPMGVLGITASGMSLRLPPREWVIAALAVVCLALVGALVVGVVAVWVRARRRYKILRRAGLRFRVSPLDPWSPETIEAVFVAFNPARIRSRASDERPYDVAARAIFGVLPQHEPGQRELFDELFDQSFSRVSQNGVPRPRVVRRVANRLWGMHAAAFQRWESDD
jgi:hypothetical protein